MSDLEDTTIDPIEALQALYPDEADAPVRDAIAKFGGQFGADRIAVVDTECGTAIFRAPRPEEYQRFKENLFDDKPQKKASGGDTLVKNTVCYPDKQVFLGWLTRYPAITTGCLKHVTELAGGEVKQRGKE